MLTKRWQDYLVLPVVAAMTVILDQIAKQVVLAELPGRGAWVPIPALERWFSFTLVTNSGAAFGLFPGFGSVFMVVAMIVVVVIAVYYWHMPQGQLLVKVSLGLQLGGAIGNLMDRLQYGYVVDFIDFRVWPVFNLADASIVLGVILLAYALLSEPEEKKNAMTESQGDSGSGL